MRRIATIVLLLVRLFAIVFVAAAASQAAEPLRLRFQDVERRVDTVERRVDNAFELHGVAAGVAGEHEEMLRRIEAAAAQRQAELLSRLARLEAEAAARESELRGEIGRLEGRVRDMQEQIDDLRRPRPQYRPVGANVGWGVPGLAQDARWASPGSIETTDVQRPVQVDWRLRRAVGYTSLRAARIRLGLDRRPTR